MKTNMTFAQMGELLKNNFHKMCANTTTLYRVNVDKEELWNTYLDSFPTDKNPIYRTRREFDCSCCRSFIKNMGDVVSIKNGIITSIWDFTTEDDTYQPMLTAMSKYIHSRKISKVFITKDNKIGTPISRELCTPINSESYVKTWDHFYLDIPKLFVDKSSRSIEDLEGYSTELRNVFKRSLDNISMDSIDTVLELISQNSLYKGNEWNAALTRFKSYKTKYDKLVNTTDKELFCWENFTSAGEVVGKIKNHSIGTLLINITEGMDLDTAVKKYEQIVAPSNYKRPKAIYTKKMLEDAKKTITDLGYLETLPRRYAKLDDITVNNILFCNKDSAKRISGIDDIFESMGREVTDSRKKFSRVEEVSIDKFISDILPSTTELEVYFENKHINNMVSLIAPVNKDSKTMFKWDNNFSWAYTGNITDSMKDRVQKAGGHVEGDLRFSIQWNDLEDWNKNDLDAHAVEPTGYEIEYTNKGRVSPNGGMLDVDIINPSHNVPAVENIIYKNKSSMKEGTYRFFVHCFTYRGGRDGFRAEIECDGQIYSFDYSSDIKEGKKIPVADVTLKNGIFTVKNLLPSTVSSREVWGIHTNAFVPVSVVMLSPNYWDEQFGIGNKHYFFMLKDCVNSEEPNGFFNEYLKEDLIKHKRVFEALGSKMKVENTSDQLSGIGFSSTQRNDIMVKVKGATERIIKVKF